MSSYQDNWSLKANVVSKGLHKPKECSGRRTRQREGGKARRQVYALSYSRTTANKYGGDCAVRKSPFGDHHTN